MGSLERRIEVLERTYGASTREGAHNPERERLVAELRQLEAKHGTFGERARCEAAEGYPQRLRALEELEEAVRRRLEDYR